MRKKHNTALTGVLSEQRCNQTIHSSKAGRSSSGKSTTGSKASTTDAEEQNRCFDDNAIGRALVDCLVPIP